MTDVAVSHPFKILMKFDKYFTLARFDVFCNNSIMTLKPFDQVPVVLNNIVFFFADVRDK
jgi:hypothetical protein